MTKIVRFTTGGGKTRLGLLVEGRVFDLTSLNPRVFGTWEGLVEASLERHLPLEELVKEHAGRPGAQDFEYSELVGPVSPGSPRLILPLQPSEVWGAGLTYAISASAREQTSSVSGMYAKVASSERPPLFLKGTARSCAGPSDPIGIRFDSKWNVPEAEIAFVLGPSRTFIGFTIGNDVTARTLERENPLYLTQSKVYDNSCALGPCVLLHNTNGVPVFNIRLRVIRRDTVVLEESTSTAKMTRSFEQIRDYLTRCNQVPLLTVCLTGTGIVPPPDFSLEENDVVEISVDQIGVLRNPVKLIRQ